MAPKPKDPNPSGLGRAIINRKVKDARKQDSGLYISDLDASNRLKSVTQERDLDEFLNTAQLAGTEFTAERRNMKIIQQSTRPSQNPYLLSEKDEKKTLEKHDENKKRLRVPRRPPWNKTLTTAELDKQERAAFLDWRRGLAQLQEQDNFILTPFERNLEVWRQLWRVLERSHLVVQIVDARNPLRFRCEDLEAYVHDVEGAEGEMGTGKGKRRNLLLINKADLLTTTQRSLWADYFDSQGIHFAFFSAADAAALQQAKKDAIAATQAQMPNTRGETDDAEDDVNGSSSESSSDSMHDDYFSAEEGDFDVKNARTKVLSVVELENWFMEMAPELSVFADSLGNLPSKLVVGLVGYPNVGKSSTINSLLGEKKVSVSSTPGKTKHFQTIHLSDAIILCDCPGLVFPQFATTKADLVCDGILPIDQLREFTGPTALVVRRIPQGVLETTYGLSIRASDVEEGGEGRMTARNFLIAYAIARGYMRSGQGNPDEARSARYVLKDYVNGKLLFCNPPPGISGDSFNRVTHHMSLRRFSGKKRAPTTRVAHHADTFIPSDIPESGDSPLTKKQGLKSQAIDRAFFENNTTTLSSRPFIKGSLQHRETYSRVAIYPHQNNIANDGTPMGARDTRETHSGGDKHHKKMKRQKHRSGKGYD